MNAPRVVDVLDKSEYKGRVKYNLSIEGYGTTKKTNVITAGNYEDIVKTIQEGQQYFDDWYNEWETMVLTNTRDETATLRKGFISCQSYDILLVTIDGFVGFLKWWFHSTYKQLNLQRYKLRQDLTESVMSVIRGHRTGSGSSARSADVKSAIGSLGPQQNIKLGNKKTNHGPTRLRTTVSVTTKSNTMLQTMVADCIENIQKDAALRQQYAALFVC